MEKKNGAHTAYENPLIPNARLREIYRAMLHAQMLGRVLPSRRREGSGFEACLVSTSVDLGPGDLISDAFVGGPVEYLRGASLASVLHPSATAKKRAHAANCGNASCLPVAHNPAERIWTALGAAAALKSRAAQAAAEAKAAHAASTQSGVVLVYLLPGEMQPALWQRTLAFAAEHKLPVVFVSLPPAQAPAAKSRLARLGSVSTIALRCHVPGIPVDADDAVAIYRVAQESIGHARIGGGPALLECIPCILPEAHPVRKPSSEAIAALERYILDRGIVTRAWLKREANSFALRIAG
jgi:TPP-dependent pyruvate/acetoin dehydrogenase alpha subunit